jgi:hypothetical protein
MIFQDDIEAAQLQIDLNTIMADDREEMMNLMQAEDIETQLGDMHECFGFSVEPYANFSDERIIALAEKHGLNGSQYLDRIADMRDQILQCRQVSDKS